MEQEGKGDSPNYDRIDEAHADIYELAHILFEEGRYQQCEDVLVELEKQDMKEELWLKVTWVRAYCQLLLGKDCLRLLESLKKKIDDITSEELAFYIENKKNVPLSVGRAEPS